MTISSTTRKAGPYLCNGVTTGFPFEFKVFAQTDLVVVHTNPDGVETVLTLGADYSVDLSADQETAPGGVVNVPVAPPTGELMTLASNLPNLQELDLTNLGGFYPVVINKALDKATIQIQQLAEQVERSVRVPISDSRTPADYWQDLFVAADAAADSAEASAANAATSADNASASKDAAADSATAAAESAASVDAENIAHKTDLAAPTGAGLIGTAQGGTVQEELEAINKKVKSIVYVNDFATGGTGTDSDPWVGWDTALPWAAYTQYNFTDGYYAYATSPNFANYFLCLNGSKNTVIRHTGTGYAMVVDAGPNAEDLFSGVNIGGASGIVIESNAAASGGVYMRGIVHSNANIRFHNVPYVCFTEVSGVLNTIKLETTALIVGATISPVNLYLDDRRGPGQECCAGTYQLIAENCTGYGVALNYILNSIFYGGTSETNYGGYYLAAGVRMNTFLNVDLEGNTGPDLTCLGLANNFIGTISLGEATISGRLNVVQGGAYNKITSGGENNVFENFSYSNNGGPFTEIGVGTTTRSLWNAANSTMRMDYAPNKVDAFKSGNGVVTLPHTVTKTLFSADKMGRYEIFAAIPSGNPQTACSATVLNDGAGAARMIANNGTALTLSLSGLAVQATQSNGSALDVTYSYIRIF